MMYRKTETVLELIKRREQQVCNVQNLEVRLWDSDKTGGFSMTLSHVKATCASSHD